jgi:type I restriction enzyme S subunit
MTGRYKAYPEYKESGSYWLGKIPAHWAATELKRYSHVKGGYAFSSESFKDSGKPVIRIGDIKQDGSISIKNCKYIDTNNSTQLSQYLVSKGDLLMAMTGATIGKAGWYMEDEAALLNQRVGAFKCDEDKLNYQFFWYVLNSLGYQSYITLTAFGGAQPNISDTGMVGYCSAVPTIEEQQKIANFLDHETAKIDTLIAKQEKLIELLKEKRQAVISHAVTKGLNPDAPMKDSGVEWLGEVPEHWAIRRVKNCASLVSEKETIEGQSVIALENIESLTGKFVKSESTYSGEDVAFIKNDILFSKLRPYLAKVYQCRDKGIAFGDLLTYRPFSDTNSAFLFYSMISAWFIEIVDSSTYGAKMPRASSDFVSEMYIAFPSQKEQEAIAKYLDKTLLIFDELSQKSKNTINLMQERKTALISAAVTGKIDVRNWQGEA